MALALKMIEFIHHFTCDKCHGWWSVASHEKYKPKKMYCPHCGYHHMFQEHKEGELK